MCADGLIVGGLDLTDIDMAVVRLCDITTEPEASMETLLGVLSEHIDTLADTSHYFVIDPSNTALARASVGSVSWSLVSYTHRAGSDVYILSCMHCSLCVCLSLISSCYGL